MILFIIPLALLLFAACENPQQPFKAGLGPVVDLRPPTVKLVPNPEKGHPGVGDYIRGQTTFGGNAEDDYKLDSVWFRVTNYAENENPYFEWQQITPVAKNGDWTFTISTTGFKDGDLTIRLRAVDSLKKETVTDELAFLIKNDPPQISLGLPDIKEGDADGQLGGRHLNYARDNQLQVLPSGQDYPRKLDAEGMIVGMIRDNEGVNFRNEPNENPDEAWFPPQYRLWRVHDTGADGHECWAPETLPPDDAGWIPFEQDGNIIEVGANNYTFSINLIEKGIVMKTGDILSDQFYALQLRVQSSDRNEFHYPKDYWSNPQWNELPGQSQIENSYVLMYLHTPKEPPFIKLHQFEDILGKGAWNGETYNDIPGVDKNGKHPYVNRVTVSKNGPFILRVEASHPDGISYEGAEVVGGGAVVYWESGNRKGRFIWDRADVVPYEGWGGGVIPTSHHYTYWSYADPQSSSGMEYTKRTFIFTFNDDPEKDKIPNEGIYNASVRGRSKIQVFTGTDDEWASRPSANWPFSRELGDEHFIDISTLEDGTYNLEIWASSIPRARTHVPFTCSISIDRTPPDITLNTLEGSVTAPGYPAYTVNGVIRPKLLFSDSLPTDTGLRNASDSYFIRPDNGRYGYEQRYILVLKTDEDKFNDYLASEPDLWPPTPNSAAASLNIPGIDVKKHGAIFDSQFLLKTSPIYLPGDPAEGFTLPDGAYSLFVLARDNVFNVGKAIIPLHVNADSDKPAFDTVVGGINLDVAEPDIEFDWPDSLERKGFVVWDTTNGRTVRNKLNANSVIRLKIRDDDSLDLGTSAPGVDSQVTVTLVGSYIDGDDKIKPYDTPAYLMTLDPVAVKTAFGTQPDTDGKRDAVKEQQGNITQSMLLTLLKANSNYDSLFGITGAETPSEQQEKKDAYNSLPSGIYRMVITVKDYNDKDIKLVMNSGDAPAEVAVSTKTFWLAVDSTYPTAEITSPVSGGYISPTDPVPIQGSVTDQNGPITVKSFEVDPKKTDGSENVWLCDNEEIDASILANRTGTTNFASDFNATVNLNGNSGVFTFTLTFIDRFGNERAAAAKYTVDGVPPTVGLSKIISVFERNEDDVILTGPQASSAAVNKARLTNGVIEFNISAVDNFKVKDVRWWLLPVDRTAEATSLTSVPLGEGKVTSYNAYPNLSPTDPNDSIIWYGKSDGPNQDGAYGEIKDFSFEKSRVVIDTAELLRPDGEYRLHVIAKDWASPENTSADKGGETVVQEIFLLQEQDKPYLSGITPQDVPENIYIDKSGLTIRGNIFEDDGFSAAPGATPVELWWNNAGTNGTTDIDLIIANPTAYGYTKATGLTGVNPTGNNLTLAIPLTEMDTSGVYVDKFGLNMGSDGRKYFILRATDDHTKKIKADGTPETLASKAAARAMRYTFTLDTIAPKITINAAKTVFGHNAVNDFTLTGTLEDANLETDENGSYYFKYWLDHWPQSKEFSLGGTTSAAQYIDSVSGGVVHFTIPATKVAEILEFENGPNLLPEGPATLTVSVMDKSGKGGEAQFNFTKDISAPTFSFTGIGKLPLPTTDDYFNNNIGNWWTKPAAWTTTVSDQTWLERKRTWLYDQTPEGTNNLIIFNDTGALALSGIFEDGVSDIDIRLGETTTFKYWIDNAVSPATAVSSTFVGSGTSVTWSIPLNLADGVHTIRFEISDVSGNTYTSVDHVFILDSAAPTNEISPPDDGPVFGLDVNAMQGSFGSGTLFTITGSATDASLQDLGFKIVKTGTTETTATIDRMFPFGTQEYASLVDGTMIAEVGGAIATGTWNYSKVGTTLTTGDNVETFNWTFNFTTAFYQILLNNSKSLVDGQSYDIVTIATDRHGNKSVQRAWSFIVTTASPAITFDGGVKSAAANDLTPSSYDPFGGNVANRNRLSGDSPQIRGGVTDQYSPIKALQSRLEQWNYDDGTWSVVDGGGIGEGWKDIPLAGNTALKVNWTYTPGVTLAQGFYRLRVQAKNFAFNMLADTAPGDTYAAGRPGNPKVSDYVYFFYDSGDPDVTFDPEVAPYYSARLNNGILTFTGTAKDPNRLRRVAVTVTVNRATSGSGPISTTWDVTNPHIAEDGQSWELHLEVPYLLDTLDTANPPANQDYVLDGNYRLEFTATDMAGNAAVIYSPFTLDSTRPSGVVEEPALENPLPAGYPYASVKMLGGVSGYAISGRTEDVDPSNNKTESGVAEVWYHLGFIDNDATWPTPQKLWAAAGVSGIDSGNTDNNALFNTAAGTNTTAWFKLEQSAATPPGFNATSTSIFDWRFGIGGTDDPHDGLKSYAVSDGIQLKTGGPTYTPAETAGAAGTAGRKLTEKVYEGETIYRLPLWFRVVDTAGNVGYFCRDIWINRDGDIPQTTINNPANDPTVANASATRSPRGGPIRADGTATNNESIYAVIYRVYADGNPLPSAALNDADLVTTFQGAKSVADNRTGWPTMQTLLGGAGITTNGWYLANNDVDWGNNKNIPWNFTFNNNREITDLISARGFVNATGATGTTTTRDTIRVTLQVVVFKGNDIPQRISNGLSTTTPEPYARTLFINQSAPEIKNLQISKLHATDPNSEADNEGTIENGYLRYSSRVLRKGQFTVKATLNASSLGDTARHITEISIRRPNELPGATSYVPAWENGNYTTITGGRREVPGVTVTPIAGTNNYEFTYILNSTADSVPNNDTYGIVRDGGWRLEGGNYQIEIRIKDNATPAGEASYTFELGIDNFAPVADTHANHLTPNKAAGSNVSFIGRALDYKGGPNSDTMTPADRKVQKIMAWFTKTITSNGTTTTYFINPTVNYYNQEGGINEAARKAINGTGNNDPQTAYRNRNYRAGTWTNSTDTQVNPKVVTMVAEGTQGNVDYPAGGTTGGWVKELSEGTATPGSGISWVPDNDWDIDWGFQQDTTRLPDGLITLHYLIYDEAGNASYYPQTTVVMNRYPVISQVTLITDNTGVGAVYTTEYDEVATGNIGSSSYTVNLAENRNGEQNGYLNSGFISKNKFIGFRVSAISGNAPLHYRLHYVTRQSVFLTENNLKAMAEIKKKALDPSYDIDDDIITASTLTGTELNLFTINALGSYGSTVINGNSDWYKIGVNAAVIRPGTHFVFTADDALTDVTRSNNASVWAYTPVLTNNAITGVTDNNGVGWVGEDNQDNTPNLESRKFRFKDDNFGTGGSQINEFLNDAEPAFFLIKVWDSVNDNGLEFDQLYDALVVGMKVYLSDSTNPKVRLYDLNPYAENAVSGYNVNADYRVATIANAADPKGIGQNILRGGLYNINTVNEPVKSGHIEPRNNTTALTPPFYNWGAETGNLGTYDSFTNRNADGRWLGDTNLPAGDPARNADDAANASFDYDQVSGRVILRGIVWDDQLIRNIRIKIGADDGADGLTILQLSGDKMVVPAGVQAYHRERLHWKNGHIVEWAYVWDTEAKPGLTGGNLHGNVNVQVFARDHLGGADATAPATGKVGLPSANVTMAQEIAAGNVNLPVATKAFHNQVDVTIAPYVAGFERAKPQFVTKRSLQGWYSFYQGEERIAALGYNLRSSTGNNTVIRVFTATNTSTQWTTSGSYDAAANTAAQNGKPVSDYTRYLQHILFDVPVDGASGQIALRVNSNNNGTTGTAALNHSTSDTKSWNREYSPNVDGSRLWINKPYAHVWRSQQNGTAPATYFGNATTAGGSNALQSPSMKLVYTAGTTNTATIGPVGTVGRLVGGWASYGEAALYMGLNNGSARQTVKPFAFEPSTRPDIGYFNSTDTTGNGNYRSVFTMAYTWQQDGNASVNLKTLTAGQAAAYDERTVIASTTPTPTERWQNIRVAVRGTGAAAGPYNYVSVFDSYEHNLRYANTRRNGEGANAIVLDGANANANVTNYTMTGVSVPPYGAYTNTAAVGAAVNAGRYNAIDYDATGPIVAYYDGNTVRLAMGRAVAPTTAANQWYRRYVLPSGHPLFNNSGQYISMKIDSTKTQKGANGTTDEELIHLAFYNSNLSTVVYAVGSRTGPFTAYTIDHVVKGGVWTSISVDGSGNPYIVYGDLARTGLRDGVRMAYKSSGNVTFNKPLRDPANSNEMITGWEALTMPSNYTVNDDRLCVEAWPPVNRSDNNGTVGTRPTADTWNAAVGYASDMFRIAYFYNPAWKGY